MKRKMTCAVSMILAALMTASPVMSSMETVFAKTSTDSIPAESTDDSSNTGNADAKSGDPDVDVSISYDADKEYSAGDSVPISVDVSNNETSDSELRLYFWNYGEDLPEEKDTWGDLLKDAETGITINELDKDGKMSITLSDNKENTEAELIQEKEDESEKVIAEYLKVTIPAGTNSKFDLTIASEDAKTVTIAPRITVDSEETIFDATQIKWKEVAEKNEEEKDSAANNSSTDNSEDDSGSSGEEGDDSSVVPDDEITAVLNGTYGSNSISTFSLDDSEDSSSVEYTEEEIDRLTREYRRESAAASLAASRATSWCSITPGTDHAYGSWATCEFRVDREGTISQGYCAEPNSDTPDGVYQAYELASDQLKAILMFAPGGPLFYQEFWETYGQNPATGGVDGNDAYSLAHACIGLEYSGQTTGLSDTDVDEIRAYIALCDVGFCKEQAEWNQYKAYIAYTGEQDVVWLEKVPNKYTDITVTKKWVDGNNTVGIRPASIKVNLYRSTQNPVPITGTPFKTVTLSESNNWTYTWHDLLKEEGDTSYNFRITEASVPNGYKGSVSRWSGSTSAGFSATITNPIDWSVPITVTKSWSDYNNDLGARPSSIKVNLYRSTTTPVDTSGTPYATATLNASNNWTYTWQSLLKQSGNTSYNYSVREVVGSSDYSSSQSAWSGNSKNGYSKTITNTLLVGYLKLHKDSSLPAITNGNDCYSLAGAEYTVYATYSRGQLSNPVGKLTTNPSGDTNTLRLLRHTYYIKETKAATGYELDNTVYTVTLNSSHTQSSPYMLKVKDVPGNDPSGLQITKIWNGDETGTIPTLEGTQFTIKYYDGYYTKNNLPRNATKTWVFEIKEVNGRYQLLFTDSYLVDESSDTLYYDGAGNPCLPYGTISIQETKPAAGYTLNGTLRDQNGNVISTNSEIYVAQITKENGAVQLQGGNKFSGYNTPISGSVTIKKYDSDGATVLPGVTFEIKNSDGEVVGTATTNSKGEVIFKDLYPDIYTITETETVDGHSLLAEPFEVEVPTRVTDVYIKDHNVDQSKVIYDEADDIYYIHNFTYNVSNSATFEVPMTGASTSMRTFIPLIVGFTLILGAGMYGMHRRKRG